MANNHFSFKQFTIWQDKSAFKVGTDGVLLGACTDLKGVSSILEIGSGSGLITLMLAQRSNATITAIEPDQDSYNQCCENVSRTDWHNRIKVVHTDLRNFNPLPEKYDLLVTNPPYFSDSLKSPDPRKSAARHNDSLSSGEILEGAGRLLKEDGRMELIMPYVEGNIFIAAAGKYDFFCNNILKIRPLPESNVRRLILTFSRTRKSAVEKFLTIEHGRHQFTEDYINLTKDFYLKF